MFPRLLITVLLLLRLSASIDPFIRPKNPKTFHGNTTTTCIHDRLIAKSKELGKKMVMVHSPGLPVRELKFKDPLERKRYVEQFAWSDNVPLRPHFDPIRIDLVTDLLTTDPYVCYRVGQMITVAAINFDSELYQCQAQDVLTFSKMDYLLNTLLSSSLSFIERTLSVMRSKTNLTLDLDGCTPSLLEVPVPPRFTTQGGGVDADYVLFVTARPILGDTLAFAGSCAFNNMYRPIAGQVNLNPASLVDDPSDFLRQRGLVIHEICHALGFTSDNFGYPGGLSNFIEFTGYNPTTQEWNFNRIDASLVQQVGFSSDGLNSFNILVTPIVTETVRRHFGCDSAPGLVLEDGDVIGTSGSHPEKRLFYNDFMTCTDSEYPVLSNITFAVFEDSGWYQVDYSATETLLWGYTLGCGFLDDCGGWTHLPNIPTGFCDQTTPETEVFCTFDRRAYGECNIKTYSQPLVEYYQHYGSPYIGGQSLWMDYCGYVGQKGNTVFCNIGNYQDVKQPGDIITDVADTGQVFSTSSRCMWSTLSKVNNVIDTFQEAFSFLFTPQARSARCYNTSCVDVDDLRVQVDQIWYPCNSGQIRPVGWAGFLECPPPQDLCTGVSRDITWPRVDNIEPHFGPPSTVITITGNNFDIAPPYTVIVEEPCPWVQVVDKFTIVAELPNSDNFVSIMDLAAFVPRKDVIIKDGRGYTVQALEAFTIQVFFNSSYLSSILKWMGANPLWGFLLWLFFLIPCFSLCYCCYRSLVLRRMFRRKVGAIEFEEEDYEMEAYMEGGEKSSKPVIWGEDESWRKEEDTESLIELNEIGAVEERKRTRARFLSAGVNDPNLPGLKEWKGDW